MKPPLCPDRGCRKARLSQGTRPWGRRARSGAASRSRLLASRLRSPTRRRFPWCQPRRALPLKAQPPSPTAHSSLCLSKRGASSQVKGHRMATSHSHTHPHRDRESEGPCVSPPHPKAISNQTNEDLTGKQVQGQASWMA